MKKRIVRDVLLISLSLLVAMLLSACGAKNVSEKQILSDLRADSDIQNCFESEYVPFSQFEVEECEILSEYFREEFDALSVYCNVTASNEYFRAVLETELSYDHSDKGDWILDDISFHMSDIRGIKAPDPSYVEGIIRACTVDHFSCSTPYRIIYFDNDNQSLSISGTSLSEDGKSAFVHCCHETTDGVKYYGDYYMSLDRDGWQFPDIYFNGYHDTMFMEMTDSTQDYSKGIGEFCDSWNNGYLTVSSIKDDVVTYSLHSESEILGKCGFEQGDNLTAPFDSKFGAFLEIIYMPEQEEWVFGGVTFERVN